MADQYDAGQNERRNNSNKYIISVEKKKKTIYLYCVGIMTLPL